MRLLMLGRMAEIALLSDEHVVLNDGGGRPPFRDPGYVSRGKWLRVDGEWPLTPSQARLIQKMWREQS